MKNIILAIVLTAITAWAVNGVINNQEKRECRRWQANPQLVTQDWQYQQCEHHKIPLHRKIAGQIADAATMEKTPEQWLQYAKKHCGQDDISLENPGWCIDQDGIASWYDYGIKSDLNYSKTHNTAASRKYKRGTMLSVCSFGTDTALSRCIDVKINDYGPSAKAYPDRIIDLSSHAFAELFPLSKGIGQVYVRENN